MKYLHHILVLLLIITAYSCKKKEGFEYDNRITATTFSNSSTRIVNLSFYMNELTVNSTKLTNYLPNLIMGISVTPQINGTVYFPSTGKFKPGDGVAYYVPQNVLKSDGSALIKMSSDFAGAGAIGFNIQDNFNNPLDYYVHSDTVVAIPRSVSSPSGPSNFKIRLLNLTSTPDQANLNGPLTLAYADGTSVNTLTTNIKQDGYSPYIELPYGSYQFKILTQTGAQLPGASFPGIETFPVNQVDLSTGIMVDGQNNLLNNTYAPIQFYAPGGVYTLVASINHTFFDYLAEAPKDLNSFRVITDVKIPINLSYAHIQAVNVIPGSTINVQVDGQTQAASLAYTAHTDYLVYTAGTHDVRALDQNGKIIAETSWPVSGNDEWTAWVYTVNGKAAIAFANNNLSGNYYDSAFTGDAQTGANGIVHLDYTPQLRFLNFSQDQPYITFSDQNGQPLQQNLAQGQVITQAGAYSIGGFSYLSSRGRYITELPYTLGIPPIIRTYQSQLSPLVVPGNLIISVPSLPSQNFIANTANYQKGGYTGLPAYEMGYYSVALVGNTLTSQDAQLIIIKHNK